MRKTISSLIFLVVVALLITGCGGSKESASSAQATATTSGLRIASLDAKDAFSVFLNAVKDLRQIATDKEQELRTLQQQFANGTIAKKDFDPQNYRLQVELLQANLNIDIGALNKMLASDNFADMRSYLQQLQAAAAKPLAEKMDALVSAVTVGAIDPQELETRYAQMRSDYQTFDQLLIQAATVKIVQVGKEVALENGYDLVLRSEDVIIYSNVAKIANITDSVKSKLGTYF
jgi:Skp family chaperone for outer membrane proteins